jgi:hypothetical protein
MPAIVAADRRRTAEDDRVDGGWGEGGPEAWGEDDDADDGVRDRRVPP